MSGKDFTNRTLELPADYVIRELSPYFFRLRSQLDPRFYYIRLGQLAIEEGLITDQEFKSWANFATRTRLPIQETIDRLERIVKARHNQRRNTIYWRQRTDAANDMTNPLNQLMDKAINAHPKATT